jgi:hypothetical protein
VLRAIERDGHETTADRLSMTGLLEDALDASEQESFSGTYDPDLGYLKTFSYVSGPEEEPGGYGFEVPCFEPRLDEAACAEQFRLDAREPRAEPRPAERT